jgi:hypothetical protein
MYRGMIIRLSSPAARGLLVLFALVLAVGLSYSGIRNAVAANDAGLNTAEGFERAARLEPDSPRNWYLLGRYWQYNLEFDSKILGSAWIDDVALVPESAERSKQ